MPLIEPPSLPDFIASLLPFERKAYELEKGNFAGHLIHFLDHGSRTGQVVLMLHGNPTWSFLWRKVITALDPDQFRCVAPDLLGLGCSSKPRETTAHTLAGHVEVMCEWFEALDLQDVILVGQDWGGPIVTGIGARFPNRIKGIVLGNTSVRAPRNPRGSAVQRFSRLPLLSDFGFRVLGFPQNVLGRVQGDPASIRGDVARAYRWPLRGYGNRAAPLAMARMVPNSTQHPSMALLKQIEAWMDAFEGPMALVWGERDPILGGALKTHVEAFPQAKVTRTEAGHFLQEEVPQEIADAIVDVSTRSSRFAIISPSQTCSTSIPASS